MAIKKESVFYYLKKKIVSYIPLNYLQAHLFNLPETSKTLMPLGSSFSGHPISLPVQLALFSGPLLSTLSHTELHSIHSLSVSYCLITGAHLWWKDSRPMTCARSLLDALVQPEAIKPLVLWGCTAWEFEVMLGLKYQKCQEVRRECSGICKVPVATTGQSDRAELRQGGDWRGLQNPDPVQRTCWPS